MSMMHYIDFEAHSRAQTDFEASLTVGSPVQARWSHGGTHYMAPGVIAEVAPKSYRVTITEPGNSAHGSTITIPRIGAASRRMFRCVAPVGGGWTIAAK